MLIICKYNLGQVCQVSCSQVGYGLCDKKDKRSQVPILSSVKGVPFPPWKQVIAVISQSLVFFSLEQRSVLPMPKG